MLRPELRNGGPAAVGQEPRSTVRALPLSRKRIRSRQTPSDQIVSRSSTACVLPRGNTAAAIRTCELPLDRRSVRRVSSPAELRREIDGDPSS